MLTDLYLFSFLSHLSNVIELLCFVSISVVIVCAFAYILYKSSGDKLEIEVCAKYLKYSGYISLLMFFIYLLVPNEKVLALIMIAPYIEDNRQTIQAMPKELGDFLLEIVKQWGQK